MLVRERKAIATGINAVRAEIAKTFPAGTMRRSLEATLDMVTRDIAFQLPDDNSFNRTRFMVEAGLLMEGDK